MSELETYQKISYWLRNIAQSQYESDSDAKKSRIGFAEWAAIRMDRDNGTWAEGAYSDLVQKCRADGIRIAIRELKKQKSSDVGSIQSLTDVGRNIRAYGLNLMGDDELR